jgi:putative hydrolase of the HAD superfamily
MMNGHRETPATVFVDADNTLWDTDGIFAAAQLHLLAAVESVTGRQSAVEDRLAFVRAADQGIAEHHHAGLRYPPRLLIAALADALLGEDVARAAHLAIVGSGKVRITEDVMGDIETAYFSDLGRPPAIRSGVKAGLLALEAAGCTVLIITEAARAKVERTTERLGLDTHFTRIVEGVKRPELYRRILRLTGTLEAFMVGDQLDRDIAPAKAAGLETIYFPGGFQPRWSPTVEKINPDHTIASFAEVPDIVLGERDWIAAS